MKPEHANFLKLAIGGVVVAYFMLGAWQAIAFFFFVIVALLIFGGPVPLDENGNPVQNE